MARAEILHWNPSDYLSDHKTLALTLEEEGAYRRLLDHMWTGSDEQCTFPLDYKALAVIWRVPPEQAERICDVLTEGRMAVLKVRKARTGTVLESKRLKTQAEKARDYAKTQAAKGRKSGAVRRANAGTGVEQRLESGSTGIEPSLHVTRNTYHVARSGSPADEEVAPKTTVGKFPDCLKEVVNITAPEAYTGPAWAFVVEQAQQRFGTILSPSEIAKLADAITAGCQPGCDGSHSFACAAQFVDKLERKGGPTFAKSQLWLRTIREDRHEVLR